MYRSLANALFKRIQILFTGLLLLFSCHNGVTQDASDRPAEAVTAATLESMSEKIFDAKKAISAETSEWEKQRALFTDLIAIREKEIGEIDEFTAGARERIEDVKKKRETLTKEKADRKAWRTQFLKRVQTLEEKMIPAVERLPQPILDKVELAVDRLKIEDKADLPLQDRFRDILTILAAVQDFSNRITVDTEIREFEGTEREIDILYLGLTRAWFADRTGKVAGTGRATADGWVWEQDRSLGSKIRNAIDVQRREAPAAMVALPFDSRKAQKN